jgi:hypothetical protein
MPSLQFAGRQNHSAGQKIGLQTNYYEGDCMRASTIDRLHKEWQAAEQKYQQNRARIIRRPQTQPHETPAMFEAEMNARRKDPELKAARDAAYLAYSNAQAEAAEQLSPSQG